MRIKYLLFLFLSAMILVNGCSKDTEESAAKESVSVEPPNNLVEEGTLTYATAATYAPFEYSVDGEYVGFDIDLAEALAQEMGLDVDINAMNFDGLIPALNGNRVDIINSAMYMTEERKKEVDFVKYLNLGNSIVVEKGNPHNIESLDDLSGLTVTVTRGGISEDFANEQNEIFKKEGKEEAELLTLPTANDTVIALRNGRADALLKDTPGSVYLLEKEPETFEIAGNFSADTEIGIAVRKGDDEMKSAIEEALDALVENGKFDELLSDYDFPDETNPFK